MKRSVSLILSSLAILSFLLSACAASGDAAQTAAAAILDAGVAGAAEQAALQTSQAENAVLQTTLDALATANAALQVQGTATAAAAATAGAVAPQLIAPNGATCRVGPDPNFGKVADIPANTPVDVIARSLDGKWWQVSSPAGNGSTCWVFWSEDLDFLGEVFNMPMVAGPSLPTQTFAPTHAPGIGVRFIHTLTCSGVRLAIIRVINLGNETYQSAVVRVSDSGGTEIHRSDGNNEFLPNDTTCPGGQPTLGPGQEKYVAVSIQGAPAGTLIVRVTVCTENGTGGTCWSSTTQFDN